MDASQQGRAVSKQVAEPVEDKRSRAKRIYGWTCNLLATVLVLTAALIFGRQVLHWWQADPASVSARQEALDVVGADMLGTPGMPLEMELGDWPCALTHVDFSGDRAAARAELRRLCEASLSQASFPAQPPGPAEQRMLAGLTRQQPFKELPTGWQLYEQDGPLPLVAAVGQDKSNSASEVAAPARRVVSWGLGIHLAGTRWTLLLLTAQARSPVGGERWAPKLPPGARRNLSLAASDREKIIAFIGSGPRAEWQQFFDDQFASIAVSSLQWQALGEAWYQRYETAASLIEVVLAPAKDVGEGSELQGLVTIHQKESDRLPGESK